MLIVWAKFSYGLNRAYSRYAHPISLVRTGSEIQVPFEIHKQVWVSPGGPPCIQGEHPLSIMVPDIILQPTFTRRRISASVTTHAEKNACGETHHDLDSPLQVNCVGPPMEFCAGAKSTVQRAMQAPFRYWFEAVISQDSPPVGLGAS